MKKSILFKKILQDVKFHQKELMVSGVFGMLMAFSLVTLRLGGPLSASVTNLGGYGYGQTGTGEIGGGPNGYGYGKTTTPTTKPSDCKKPEIALTCALGVRSCPAICKEIRKVDDTKTRTILPPVKRR